jgi:hypothetical protein
MSRGLTDPFEPEEEGLPASNEDIMGVVLSIFMMLENLHQRLDAGGFPLVEGPDEQ